MTDCGSCATWFLVQFKPNSHSIAKRNLVRQGFQTFLPLHEETRRARGRFTTWMRPLFPGYLFVAFDITTDGWRKVNSTHGVTRIVSLGNKPTPVPRDLVDQLMQRCDCEGQMLPRDAFEPGDAVEVIKGPFANFIATVHNIDADRRIWLLMEIMGGQNRVSVSAEQVRAV
jgi:transcriptional antiterminator RfaH